MRVIPSLKFQLLYVYCDTDKKRNYILGEEGTSDCTAYVTGTSSKEEVLWSSVS
jgi:hypothetical protein